jgi:Family of unknown function (DUF6232)
MAAAGSFGNNQSITLEKDKVIFITNRTVVFSKAVYQIHNISGFSEGEVDIGKISWVIIIVAFILGSIIQPFNGAVGLLLDLAAIAGIIWNFVKPKHYGLLLILNSGDKTLFATTDKSGLKKVISVIYNIIETEKDATYQISIKNSQVKGNFVQGDVGGSTVFSSDD